MLGLCLALGVAVAVPAKELSECIVWTLNQTPAEPQVDTREEAELAASVPSDFLMRAWFKWRDAHDYQKARFVIPIAKSGGALFGGGTTVSALYRGENGISPAQFRRMATRDPFGHIFPAWGKPEIAHGAIASREYLDYVLRWCYGQIEAGVDGLFMDEISAAYGPFEGYDDASMVQFAQWLKRKYCDGKGWRPDDRRWREKFGIDLSDREICPDGTIGRFNYRAYLVKRGMACDPLAKDNPLAPEWGRGWWDKGTFCEWRMDQAWRYLCDHIRERARAVGRRVYIHANGLAKYVDFQVVGMGPNWLGARDGMSTAPSYLWRVRGLVAQGRKLVGRRVQVVFFHDWGFRGFPFGSLAPEQRMAWMKVYGPEFYAAGGIFCWPVTLAAQGTSEELAFIRRYAGWYRRHGHWFLKGRPADEGRVGIVVANKPRLTIATWDVPEENLRLVHVINHNWQDGIVAVEGCELQIPSGHAPKSVFVDSPEMPAAQPVRAQVRDDLVHVRLPRFEGYCVVGLRYDKLPAPEELPAPATVIATRVYWARPARSRFVIRADGSVEGVEDLCRYVQGRLHPDLRNSPVFVVDLRRPARFGVHVNSVAQMGAVLELHLDGRRALQAPLPDTDGQNDGAAGEYDQDFWINVPPGKHEIAVRNPGGDWLSVDYYIVVAQPRP